LASNEKQYLRQITNQALNIDPGSNGLCDGQPAMSNFAEAVFKQINDAKQPLLLAAAR